MLSQYLETGGAAVELIGEPVTGGLPGAVLFVDASGNLGQDNTHFYWDDANDRLGIGTSTLSAQGLHVEKSYASGSLALFKQLDINTGNIVTLDRAANVRQNMLHFTLADVEEWAIGVPSNSGSVQTAFAIGQGSSDGSLSAAKLVITTGGSVGIGTTLPNATLAVASGGGSTTGVIWQAANGTTFGEMYYSSNDMFIRANRLTTSKLYLGGSSNVQQVTLDTNTGSVGIGVGTAAINDRFVVIASGNNNGIVLQNASSQEIFRLQQDSTSFANMTLKDGSSSTTIIQIRSNTSGNNFFNTGGNFGINTATPDQALTVNAGFLHISKGATLTATPTATSGYGLFFAVDNSSGEGRIQNYSSGGTTFMTFHTSPSGSGTVEVGRFDQFGRFGLGVTPTAHLDISPPTAAQTKSAPGSSGAWFRMRSTTLTDSNTAISGTASIGSFATFNTQTYAATNTGVVVTEAMTVYIAGGVSAGTNVTLTNSHALYIESASVTGTNSYGLRVKAQSGATTNYAAAFTGGNVGIGTATATYPLTLVATLTATSGAQEAQDISVTFNPGGDVSGSQVALATTTTLASSNASNYTGTVFGLVFNIDHFGTGTVSAAKGMQGKVNNRVGGTISTAEGLYTIIQNLGSGTISSAYGLYVDTFSKATGTLTAGYGVYIADQTAAGTNYAVYANLGTSYFKDKVGLNNAAPSGQLDVIVSGSNSNDVIFGTVNSSAASQAVFRGESGGFAHGGAIARFRMMNGTDTGKVVRIENAGSGNSLSIEDLSNNVKLLVTQGGDLKINAVGAGLYVKEGTNATMGTATLSGGTIVVNTTKVTANSRIFLCIDGGTLTNIGTVYVSARTAGTSFTISSGNALDASNVAWLIVEPS